MRLFIIFSLLLLPVVVLAQDKAFVPLTNIPALTETGNSSNLPLFLNNLYKICIGLAAVLAVLQLIRAGIMYMLGDSVTEKKEARNLIGLAVMGLVLVLSPTIVFGIINKDILELNLDVKVLKVEMAPIERAVTVIPYTTDKACTDAGGKVVTVGTEKKCEVPYGAGQNDPNAVCSNYEAFQTAAANMKCNVDISENHVVVDGKCCAANLAEGQQCCARPKEKDVSKILPPPIKYSAYVNSYAQGYKVEGPLPKDASSVNLFNETCTKSNGRIEVDIHTWTGSNRTCTAEELAGYKGGTSKANLKCRDNIDAACYAK